MNKKPDIPNELLEEYQIVVWQDPMENYWYTAQYRKEFAKSNIPFKAYFCKYWSQWQNLKPLNCASYKQASNIIWKHRKENEKITS